MTERQMEILQELNAHRGDQNGFCTLQELSRKLNVSQRTISADLQEIRSWLQSLDGRALLESKRGTGIRLLTDPPTWEKICRYSGIAEEKNHAEVSTDCRIIRSILLKKRVRCSDIQEHYFLSKNQLKTSLTNVECFFGSIGIPMQIRPGSGIHIYCDAAQWRDAFWHLFLNMESELSQTADLSGIELSQKVLSLLIPGLDAGKIGQILTRLEENFYIYLTSESRKKITVYAAMAVVGYPKKPEYQENTIAKQKHLLNDHMECQMAEYLTDALGGAYGKRLSSEQTQFTVLFELAEWLPQYELFLDVKVDPALQGLAQRLVSWFSSCMNTDCSNDLRLYQALLFYLRPMLHHLEYELSIPINYENEIIRRHTFIYMICLSQKQQLEELIGSELQGREIVGLTQIFGNAWLRVEHSVKATLVCDQNYASVQSIRDQIERMIPDILIENVLTSAQKKKIAAHSGELMILCGVREQLPDTQYAVSVHMFLQKADITKLQRACEKLRRGDVEGLSAGNAKAAKTVRLFDRRIILTDDTARTKDEVLERLCDLLVENGNVTDAFFPAVIGREMQETTEIGNGFAMPHGSTATVKHSAVAVALLKKAVLWGENSYVDKIFLIAVDIQDPLYTTKIQDFYHALSLMTNNPEQCMHLTDIHSPSELEIFLNNL